VLRYICSTVKLLAELYRYPTTVPNEFF
jgi:hypothetical protein